MEITCHDSIIILCFSINCNRQEISYDVVSGSEITPFAIKSINHVGIACINIACIAFCQRISKKCKYMSNNTEVLNQFKRTYKSYYSANMCNVIKMHACGQGTAFGKYVAWSFI